MSDLALDEPVTRRHPGMRTVSFSGAGWLFTYHLGVLWALRDVGLVPRDRNPASEGGDPLDNIDGPLPPLKYAGASGGALAAMVQTQRMKLGGALRLASEMHGEATADPSKLFKLKQLLRTGLDRLMPDLVADPAWPTHVAAEAEIFVEVLNTSWPFLHLTQFGGHGGTADPAVRTPSELVDVLVASCTVPVFAGLPFRLPATGELVLDGGLRKILPRAGEPGVLGVSPFWWISDAVIKPAYIPTTWALLPPRDVETYEWVARQGYRDGMRFALRNGVVSKEESDARLARFFGSLEDAERDEKKAPNRWMYWARGAVVSGVVVTGTRRVWRRVFRRK